MRHATTATVATITPELLGLPLFQARWLASLAELSVRVTRAAVTGPAGHVVAQYPIAGEPIERSGLVHIVVSHVEQAHGRSRGLILSSRMAVTIRSPRVDGSSRPSDERSLTNDTDRFIMGHDKNDE